MSNSFPDRKKTTVLEEIEILFNERNHVAAGRFQSPNDIQHSAHIQAGRWSTRADKELLPAPRYGPGVTLAENDYVFSLHGSGSTEVEI